MGPFSRKRRSGTILKKEILNLIEKKKLVVTPLLDKNQIGEMTMDLRVGTDFLSLHQGREAYIDSTTDEINRRPIKSHFTETRRKLGETFLLHPSQTILFSTLEYIKLPANIFAVLSMRSSYSRLGLTVSTIFQPGYCGCFSIEVVNTGNTAIKIMSGARIVQARFVRLKNTSDYFSSNRKYTCQVRPVPSKANEDEELIKLKGLLEN
ncbi:dCTP deaminase [Flagellimonas allohymeniacidonis]|uniref:dCTP deaminase n=1 Tax=Flagellimonas allohymeniacidonis TaxID=2517819 RepID=A0A4Q8QEN3_9FLAO|nr:dCTP deaminase [Allomuricauda hymeniacidonis]TAI47638.1 dCTP deaminase [Allomuricauda hymeniacidonis]